MKCLIVEDNEFMREVLRIFLDRQAEIEMATNGREGVERFARALAGGDPFDLVLLDVLMPEMDGQEALRLMRQAEKEKGCGDGKTVIIMTTALDSADQMQQALWDGDCTDYIVKPVVRDDLLAMLRRYGLL